MVRTPNRRQLLGSIATLTAAGVGYQYGTEPAAADVSMGELSIPDASVTGEVHAPWLQVSGSYEYNQQGTVECAILLLLGSDDAVVAMDRFEVTPDSGTGTYTISGDLTSTDVYDASDFEPGAEHTITITVMLQCRDDGGTTIANETVSDTATLAVTEAAELTLSGDGSVEWETDSGDGSPF